MPKYMQEVVNRVVTEDVWPIWIKHISLNDHSLEDLAKLGHPYSTRYGANSFAHPDSEVHTQSGNLVETSHIVNTATTTGCSTSIINDSPHYIFLRYGTRTMRMRDPAGATMGEALPLVKKRLKEEVKNAIITLMRS